MAQNQTAAGSTMHLVGRPTDRVHEPDPTDDGADDLDRTNLYIKGLWKDCTQVELDDIFKEFGVINQSRVYGDGVGFVRFDESNAAEDAIRQLNGKPAGPRATEPLLVKYAFRKSKSPKRYPQKNERPHQHQHQRRGHPGNEIRTMKNTNNVYLRCLPKGFAESDLLNLCRPYGDLTCTRLRDSGVAFVRYKNAEDAARAIRELNGRLLGHDQLLAKLANSDPFQPKISFNRDEENGGYHRRGHGSRGYQRGGGGPPPDYMHDNEFRPQNRYDYNNGGGYGGPPRGQYRDRYEHHPYGPGGPPSQQYGMMMGRPGGGERGRNRDMQPQQQAQQVQGETSRKDSEVVVGGSEEQQQHQTAMQPGATVSVTHPQAQAQPAAQNGTTPHRTQSGPVPGMPQQPMFVDMRSGIQYVQQPPQFGRMLSGTEMGYRSAPSSISSSGLHFVQRPDIAPITGVGPAHITSGIVMSPQHGNPPTMTPTMTLNGTSPGGQNMMFVPALQRPQSVTSFQSFQSYPSTSSGPIFVPSAAAPQYTGMVAPISSNAQTVGTVAAVTNPIFLQTAPMPMQPAPHHQQQQIHQQAPRSSTQSMDVANGMASLSVSGTNTSQSR